MSNLLSLLGNTALSLLGTPGAIIRNQGNTQDVGNVMSGSQIPSYLQTPGPDQLTPDQIQAAKINQLYQLGTPEAVKLANTYTAPQVQIAQAKLPSEIGLNQANIGNINAEASQAPSRIAANYASANNANAEASLAPSKGGLYQAQTQEAYANAGKTALMQKMAALLADPNTDPTTKQQAAAMVDMSTAAKQTLEGGNPTEMAQKTKDMDVGEAIKKDGYTASNTIKQIDEIRQLVKDNPDAIGPFVGSDAGQLAGKTFKTAAQAAREKINTKTAILFGDIVKNGASGIGRLDLPIVNSFKDQTAKLTSLNPDVFNAALDNMAGPAQKMLTARTVHDMSGNPEVARLAAEAGVDTNSAVTKSILQPTKVKALLKGGMTPQDIIATLPKIQENIPTGGNIGANINQPSQADTKVLNGVTYIKQNGKWHTQ